MRLPPFLSLLLLSASPFVAAAALRPMPVSDQVRVDVRGAVTAHRASQAEDIRVQEAAAGRRLTPAERAELREQVRQQWTPHAGTGVQAQPAARSPATGQDGGRAPGTPVQPRSQRP